MALLQIAEPGLSAAPHRHRLAVGIDLGTTHSLVATVRNGSSEVLADLAGRHLLPSIVHYRADAPPEVGDVARAAAAADPKNVVVSVKRLMGRGADDLAKLAPTPYAYGVGAGQIQIETAAGPKTPVEVSADILKTLRERAEASLGGELTGAIITVPAYFDDAQRQATKDAARLAGIEVLRLLNEPTAAAIAYGLDNGSEGIYAVYDLGGGTFDLSILRLERGVFEVLATSGDSALGGDDFDECLVRWAIETAALQTPSDTELRRLHTAARRAKEALSGWPETRFQVELDTGALDLPLTRETFEALTVELVQRTLAPIKRALRDAKLKVGAIDGVVMVGGATRMPCVQRAASAFFGKPVLCNLDPDQVVALGAAIQANVLVGNRSADDWLLLDVIPLSLGLETMGGLVEKIVPRNSTLPVARAQDFTTFKDGQTAMSIHVVQGERELVAECRSLAHFELRGIPPLAAGAARIRVTFQVDADGLLSVSAREQSSGVEATVAVKPSYGLTDEEIARMLKESIANAEADAAARMRREETVEAERLSEATEAALDADGAILLDEEERARIRGALGNLRAAIVAGDIDALRRSSGALNALSQDYASRRMDAAIQTALAGRRLAEL
ncbi:MAG: Fe-S protein assembly chaperone HscA [Gammaproteobacteria bacterium]|nr:Fe-S protein assembly chaperone HscA [Gammaproteobacteria bacterium]